MIRKITNNWRFILLVIICLITGFFYSYLAITIQGDIYPSENEQKLVFNSPDETANYFFSYLYTTQNQLGIEESDNFQVNGLVSPRSMRFVNGHTVPVSFFGLMLTLGVLAKLFTLSSLVFLPSILAALAAIYFYLLIRRLFDKNIALLSTIFFLIFPAYWYYSTRSFFNNVLFLDFLIIGLYYLLVSFEKHRVCLYFLSGFFLALSLFVRSSEVFWVAFLVLTILVINRKKLNTIFFLTFIPAGLLVALPLIYYNYLIYGQPISIGYNISFIADDSNFIYNSTNLLKQLLLPFGVNIQNILKNSINYFVNIFWWYFVLLFWSICYVIYSGIRKFQTNRKFFGNKEKQVLAYFVIYILISAYLILLYGSWSIVDNPDPTAVTIGTSYVRYFLPVYIFSLPLISYFLLRVFKINKIIRHIFILLILFSFFAMSLNIVFFDSEEGILKIENNILNYQQIADNVIKMTETNSIIIAEKNDKVFFPARRVIYKLNNEADYQAIDTLLQDDKIYWWRFKLNNDDLQYIENKNLKNNFFWSLEPASYCFENQCLYPIKKLN